ncbi:MAG: trigger factor [Lachnospiraceae bacterium]|nr:trigger factor [Lachnospiraceae bacterium]MBR5738886.1 trigger factor [Lachnospiraceae bacterium]
MSVQVEKLEGNYAVLTVESTPEEFEEAVQKAYLKNRGRIQLAGFRKGKAPRAMIEKIYGEGVFYEDAANELIQTAYYKALDDEAVKELSIVSRPEIEVTGMGKGVPFVFTAKVALKPAVELGKYKGFRVAKKTAEVTEEEIDAELKKTQEANSRMITVEDRPIENGDIAVIDYEGFSDGKAFDGGKAENHELEIGSHSFIDTFEEQLIGKSIGDACEVNVTFPEQYHAPELAGKPAVFKVKINGIKKKELPELDDEFASEVSEFETLKEYRESVKKELTERKQKTLDNERRDTILKKAVENAKMEIPKEMVDMQCEQMVNDYSQRLQMQGLSLDMYMKFSGQTKEQLKDSFKERAEEQIKSSLVLEAIAKTENVEVSEEDLEAEYERMANAYQMEVEKIRELISDVEKENMKENLAMEKALDLIAK